MAKKKLKLLSRKTIAEGTMMFNFERPNDFVFKSGKTIDITLINPPETDEEGNIRTFSLVSAPYESTLSIATRLRDTAFKRVLKNMPLNSEVDIEGPYGSLILQNDFSRPAVFLVGGIGITPFFSIIKNATNSKLPHKIFLFYSNRKPEDTPFLTQLEELQNFNPNYSLISTMTDMEKSKQDWGGEKGFITKEMIEKYLPDTISPIYYSAGPPEMVAAMKKLLNDMGIDDDNIRIEEFLGY
jgi:ferredoxin-NADP reductase